MEKLMTGVKQFIADEEGVTMVEYGLIAALIAIVAIAALTGTGVNVKEAFRLVCTKLSPVITANGGSAGACT